MGVTRMGHLGPSGVHGGRFSDSTERRRPAAPCEGRDATVERAVRRTRRTWRAIGAVLVAALLLAAAPSAAEGIDAPSTLAVVDGHEPEVRPGYLFVDSDGGGCTVGFLLREVDAVGTPTGAHWALAAGHCFRFSGTSKHWGPGEGPVVSVRNHVVGDAVYAHVDWRGGIDVAAIRLRVGPQHLTPSVCFWGGPTELRETPVNEGETLLLVGRGNYVHPREMTATVQRPQWVTYRGRHGGGDSGSPVLDESGAALGIHALGGFAYPELSTGAAARLPDMLALLEEQLDTHLELMTAPREDVRWPEDVLDEPCATVLRSLGP
jgi:hypothetical protein